MFAVSFIDENNCLNIKIFNSDKAAYKWLDESKGITPLKLLVWSDMLDCYDTYKIF